MEPDEWIVGIIREDGSCDTLTHADGIPPSYIDTIVFPVSVPGINEALLFDRPIQKVDGRERSSGAETTYNARVEGDIPNSDQYWNMKIDLWEYPQGVFNYSELEHSENVTNAQWNPDDLVDAIQNRFLD